MGGCRAALAVRGSNFSEPSCCSLPSFLTSSYLHTLLKDLLPHLLVTSKDFLYPEIFNILQVLKAGLQVSTASPGFGSGDKLLLHYGTSEKHPIFKVVKLAKGQQRTE